MKKLKLLGVLLVSLLLPVLVNAETEKPCVAKIDDVCYESLELAYEEVRYKENDFVAGKTIILQDDVNLREIGYNPSNPMIFDFTDNVTLDLNGHFIKARGNSVFYQGNYLTIKNGTFKTEYFGCGDIKLDDSYPLFIGDERQTSNIVLDNLTINGGVNVYNAKQVKIQNSNVTGSQAYYGVWADNDAEVIILSGNYKTLSKNGIIGMTSTKDKEGSVTVLGGTFTIGENKLFCTSTSCLSGEGFIQGGTFDKNVEDLLPNENYRVQEKDNKFIVQKELNVLVGNIEGDGDVRFDKELAFPGETVTMKFYPLEGYEFDSVEVFDENNNIIEVEDNKFTMPKTDVYLGVYFKKIPAKIETNIPILDTKEEVKVVTIGVKEDSKIEEVLLDSLKNNEELAKKVENIDVKVGVEIETLETSKIEKKVVEAIKEKAGKATIATFFDISIAVRNAKDSSKIDNITNLTKEIELMILLPEELKNNDKNVNREYFIVREHDSKVETIKAELSKDGKYLIFKTDKFSTYALAYEDKVVETEDKTVVDNNKTDSNIEVPKTFDSISMTLILGSIALISAAIISLYFKKQLNK